MAINKNDIGLGICMVLIGFFLALLLKVTIIADFDNVELAKMDGSVRVNCGSDSMGLTLRCGDVLYYRDVGKNEELVPGNIYIYRRKNDSNVVHRLIECVDIDCNLTVFKGDNNAVGEFVERKQIIRKVESVRYK